MDVVERAARASREVGVEWCRGRGVEFPQGKHTSEKTENRTQSRVAGAAVSDFLIANAIFWRVNVRVVNVAECRSAMGQSTIWLSAREPTQRVRSRMRNRLSVASLGYPKYSPGLNRKYIRGSNIGRQQGIPQCFRFGPG